MNKMGKKMLAVLASALLVAGSMPVCLAQDGAGETEIFNLNFDGLQANTPPSSNGLQFTYRGVGAQGVAYTPSDGMFGSAPSNRALKISGDKRDAAITDEALRVAIDSPNMKDKAGVLGKGEQLRLSWRMAKSDVADNNFAMIGLRGTNGTDYKTATNTFFGMATNANRDITFMNGLGRWYWSQDQWYQYDVVFTEGKNTADLYVNGFLAGVNKEFTTKLPEGYTFCGLDGAINFVIKHDHWDKDVCMYMDDYKLVKHDADHPFVSGGFSDDFSNFTGRNAQGGGYNGFGYVRIGGTGYPNDSAEPVRGMFGKAAEDTSLYMQKKEFAALQSGAAKDDQNPYLSANPAPISRYKYGGALRFGFAFALESHDLKFGEKTVTMRAFSNGTWSDAANDGLNLAATIGDGYIGMLNNKVKKQINWIPHKWYRLDIMLYPGDGNGVKNKIMLYLDGMPISDTPAEFDALTKVANSVLDGIGEVRFNNNSLKYMPGTTNGRAFEGWYLDDLEFRYDAQGSITVPQVTVGSSSDKISGNYPGTLLLWENLTAGQVLGALTVTGADSWTLVGKNGEPLQGTDQAAGGYLNITAGDTAYSYPVDTALSLHGEDFSGYNIIDNQPYREWLLYRPAGEELVGSGRGVGIGGKKADDQSYLFTHTNWSYAASTAEESQKANGSYLNWAFVNNQQLYTPEKTTLEFSMLVNDDGCTRNVLAFDYYYTDDQGKAQANGITDVINLLPNGRIVAGPGKAVIGNWKQNQWYKMACVIDPATLTMDVFINGEKKGENISVALKGSSGHEMLSIYRFKAGKHFEGFGDRTLNGYYAFDDFKCYAGDYALRAAADQVSLTSSVYNMGNPGYIRVTGTQPINTFKNNLSGLDQAESYDFYDNNTLNSQNVMRMGMWHKAVALVRSQGGAFHYYEVIDESKTPVIGEMTLKSGAYEVAPGSLLEAGKYDLTLKAEKYNDTPYPVALVLALYNGSQLTGVKAVESTLAFGENTLSCSLEIAEAGENVHLKAFLWDGLGSMIPLKEAKAW